MATLYRYSFSLREKLVFRLIVYFSSLSDQSIFPENVICPSLSLRFFFNERIMLKMSSLESSGMMGYVSTVNWQIFPCMPKSSTWYKFVLTLLAAFLGWRTGVTHCLFGSNFRSTGSFYMIIITRHNQNTA